MEGLGYRGEDRVCAKGAMWRLHSLIPIDPGP